MMGTFTPFASEAQDQESDPFGTYQAPGSIQDDPHWYSGALTALPRGVLEGAGKAVSAGAHAMSYAGQPSEVGAALSQSRYGGMPAVTTPVDEVQDPAAKEAVRENAARTWQQATQADPATTGFVGNLLHSVGEIGALGLTTGPYATGAIEADSRFSDLRAAGVDKNTALAVSGLEGVMTAAGLKASFLAGVGERWATRLATASAINVAFGATNREADHLLLERNGYTAMADQYKLLDGQAVLADAVMGAFFGGAHRFMHPEAAAMQTEIRKGVEAQNLGSDVQDAALVSELARSDREAAPGVPTDIPAAATHTARMAEANAAFGRGETPSVADIGDPDATYLHRDEAASGYKEMTRAALNDMAREFGLTDELNRLTRAESDLARRQSTEATPSASQSDSPPEARSPGSVPVASPESKVRQVLDLFGEDTRQKQALADLGRAKDEARSPNKDVPLETGDPSDMFSQARNQIDISDVTKPEEIKPEPPARAAEQVLEAKPNLIVPKIGKVPKRVSADQAINYEQPKARAPDRGPSARSDSLLEYLARHGRGIDSVEAEKQGVDKASMNDRTAKVGIKRAFRKGGMSFDEAAEALSEAGYPVKDEQGKYNPNTLLDRIDDELRGKKVYSEQNPTQGMDPDHEEMAHEAYARARAAEKLTESQFPKLMDTLTACAARH